MKMIQSIKERIYRLSDKQLLALVLVFTACVYALMCLLVYIIYFNHAPEV